MAAAPSRATSTAIPSRRRPAAPAAASPSSSSVTRTRMVRPSPRLPTAHQPPAWPASQVAGDSQVTLSVTLLSPLTLYKRFAGTADSEGAVMRDETGGRGPWRMTALAVVAAVAVLATGGDAVHVHFGASAGGAPTGAG